MKTRFSFFLLSCVFAGLILISGNSFAQQKSDDQAKSKKTITIHVTKEVDGNTVIIDTTVVTDGDFDADAYLEQKGIMNDMPESGKNVDKHIIIRHPGHEEFSWSDSDREQPDTIFSNNDTIILFSDNIDMSAPRMPHMRMPNDFNFDMPQEFSHFDRPRFEDIMEDMARSFGLENVMPFGEMKQMVVKKKRNGKKVIITFEDRNENNDNHGQGNRKEQKKVIIYNNGEQGMVPQNEERVIIGGDPGENVVIHKSVKKTGNGDEVIINAEVDSPKPVKKQTKVIIIKEDENK
jgi:hypothetical protein